MDTQMCWYCERNQALPDENYPQPYTIAKFFKGLPEGGVDALEYKIPRCVDCARIHVAFTHPLKISLQLAVLVLVVSVVLLPSFIDFYDNGQLLIGASLPSFIILIGSFISQKYRSKKIHKEIKKISDISQYPDVLASKEHMTFVNHHDPLNVDQIKALLGSEKSQKNLLSAEIEIWKTRFIQSFGLLFVGILLAGMGVLFLDIIGAFGQNGAIVFSGSSGIVFLPIGGTLPKYLFLFAFGLMAIAGYAVLIVGIFSVLRNLFMLVVNFIRSRKNLK